MFRKLLRKLGLKDNCINTESNTEKIIHENSLQPEIKNEETTKVAKPAYSTENACNSLHANKDADLMIVNNSDDKNSDLKTNEREIKMLEERKINVFVSSTFKDMQAEREELVKRIFPQLRKVCEQKGITWGEVDLRWGITDEQKAEGKVLPICLAEIDHCRPYFRNSGGKSS